MVSTEQTKTEDKKMVTKQFLLDALLAHKGATPVSILAKTIVKDIRGQEFIKINKINGFVGFDYETSVQNAETRSGELPLFEAKPRKWGKHINPQVIEHKGKHYLQIKVQSTGKPVYYDNSGRVHGRIELKPRKETYSETLGVILRDYALDNILAINWKGQRLKVA